MNRRELLLLLGAAGTAPRMLRAQPKPATGKVWRVGFIYMGSRQSALDNGRFQAFQQGMRDMGYEEGRNYSLEARFADADFKVLPDIAADLVRSKVDVIVSSGGPVSRVLREATNVVPVVVTNSVDPVQEGIAVTLARPGRNFTGFSNVISDLFVKHVDLLKTAFPGLSRLAVLSNPGNPGHPVTVERVEAAGRKLGMSVLNERAGTIAALEPAFVAMARARAGAVLVLGDGLFVQQSSQIARLAIQHRLPSTYTDPAYADAGGFMTFGPSFIDNYRNSAKFVDKILKGAKPGDLPFEEPTKLYLVLNRRTAKAIGIAIPQELVLRADRVIE